MQLTRKKFFFNLFPCLLAFFGLKRTASATTIEKPIKRLLPIVPNTPNGRLSWLYLTTTIRGFADMGGVVLTSDSQRFSSRVSFGDWVTFEGTSDLWRVRDIREEGVTNCEVIELVHVGPLSEYGDEIE